MFFSMHTLSAALLLMLASSTMSATEPAQKTEENQLKFVVMITRHGVRSPTASTAQLNQYSRASWPQWNLPQGYLTPHGYELMRLLGAYDAAALHAQGLLSGNTCDDATHIRILADSDQRTRETGKALAEGLSPQCAPEVHALAEGVADVLFHPGEAGIPMPDKSLAVAAVNGRMGGNVENLVRAYHAQLEDLSSILNTCATSAPDCSKQQVYSLLDLPASLSAGKDDHLVELRSPLSVASSLTENFLLEYAEGKETGWGHIEEDHLRRLLDLHTAQEDFAGRTKIIAQAQASNLLAHVLASIDQAATGSARSDALSKPQDKLLILAGHDTNLANIAGTLHLNWIIDGRKDDTPPGGALFLELWQSAKSHQFFVRLWFRTQSLHQMRTSEKLTLQNPPLRVPVYLPGCELADGSCSLQRFEQIMKQDIDFDRVK